MSGPTRRTRALFTGYAHVHFACFQPIYAALAARPDVEVFVSGGLRTTLAPSPSDDDHEKHFSYDPDAMYRPFGIPRERILSVERIQEEDFDVVFAGNTKIIRPRAADVAIQIFHGISFRNKAVRSAQSADFFMLVGPYMQRRFDEAGILASSDPRGIPIGFPKTDPLRDGSLDRAALLRAHGLDGERPVVLYAPTGQRGNSMERFGLDVVRALEADGRFDVIVKLHDHPKDTRVDWRAELRALGTKRVHVTDAVDVVPLLALADLLVTDASSVSSEYALTGKPVVFLDVPELLARAAAAAESALDLDTWGRRGGLVASGAEAIAEAIAHALAHLDERRDVREAMARDLFFHPGRATQAAVQWLDATSFGRSARR
ncbi:MAG: CDP-glycerol glycerophosphotransferase family protein [Sandaracinaceae bacterium]|nr:CDP-glycerol glycerophosphotransferase family protein [Sandaracinaceae bacterium]